MRPLDETGLRRALEDLDGWDGDGSGLRRRFVFSDFRRAIGFMKDCEDGIEERAHHPEWTNVYNRVDVVLRTHDAGDRVTDKDVDLARFLDGEAKRHGAR